MIVRAAAEADFAAIAEICRLDGQGPVNTGQDHRYLQHLIGYGRLLVATTPDGVVRGFAGALRVGAAAMLTDLFVHPDGQSGGTGAALLDGVLAGSPGRMTFSSHDPRAIALYTRAGMSARWPLLYLKGDPTRLGRAAVATPVSPERAGDWEQRWTGDDRTPTYRHWSIRGGDPLLIGDPAAPIAVAARSGPAVLAHVAVAPDADPAPTMLDAIATVGQPVDVYLPGPHPALPTLLRNGFTIGDFDLFMTSRPDRPGDITGAYEPGLY
jgi:GNAT superfamily N-acetyltransferase